MLRHTFIHIPGIGVKTERRLWESGILTWDEFLDHKNTIFSAKKDEYIKNELKKSIQCIDNIEYFSSRLPSNQLWRLYQEYKQSVVFLDIETTGGLDGTDEITIIGLYDGIRVYTFINGVNLENFEDLIGNYKMVVTFNGSSFDIPYIKRRFRGISLPPVHIDLRHLMKRAGFRGGLKSIEKQMGIIRSERINRMNGYDAVRLWYYYQMGDKSALDILIEYNTADIVNLKPICETGYMILKKRLLPYY